jgi:hypothetical protein
VGSKPKRRTVGQQLNRSPLVMHASWLAGLAVIISGGVIAGGFSLQGLLFLIVLFLPIVIAYRRDRLSFPIVFATLFLPAWPWALYAACTNRRRPHAELPGPEAPPSPPPTRA